ncbi:MAG: glycosyltransferase family 2 protein, partial [Candidatus Cloacimonetes bacterium]|nr:glycosyltransferase family 2 protein [Candidatus Cloacimonadota bacterium]
DGSFEIMKALADTDAQVKVIKFRRNFGKAAALQKGFDLAQGEVVFTMDADLQDDPVEIPAFLAKLEQGYDLVSGWKKKRRDPWHKKLPSKLFNSVTAHTFHLKLKDYNCGFKAYRKELVKELSLYGEMHRYIPALAHSLGFKVGEIAVQHRARQFGKSKYGIERYLRGFFDLLTVKMVTQYVKSPLYLFGRIGLVSTVLGSLITLYLAILKIFYGVPLSNRPLLFLGMLLILGGLQFISLGLISELIINRIKPTDKLPLSIESTLNIKPRDEDG